MSAVLWLSAGWLAAFLLLTWRVDAAMRRSRVEAQTVRVSRFGPLAAKEAEARRDCVGACWMCELEAVQIAEGWRRLARDVWGLDL